MLDAIIQGTTMYYGLLDRIADIDLGLGRTQNDYQLLDKKPQILK